MSSNELKRDFSPERPRSKITERASQHHLGSRNPESRVLDPSVAMRSIAEPYWCTAARRANLVVPEIGVLKWFLGSSSIASVNLGSLSLKADSECYSRALSDETRSGPRIATFLKSDFFALGLQSFTPARLLPSGEDGGGLLRALRCCCLRTWGPAQAPAFPAHAGLSCSVLARA